MWFNLIVCFRFLPWQASLTQAPCGVQCVILGAGSEGLHGWPLGTSVSARSRVCPPTVGSSRMEAWTRDRPDWGQSVQAVPGVGALLQPLREPPLGEWRPGCALGFDALTPHLSSERVGDRSQWGEGKVGAASRNQPRGTMAASVMIGQKKEKKKKSVRIREAEMRAELIRQSSKFARYQNKLQKSVVFFHTSSHQFANIIKNKTPRKIANYSLSRRCHVTCFEITKGKCNIINKEGTNDWSKLHDIWYGSTQKWCQSPRI